MTQDKEPAMPESRLRLNLQDAVVFTDVPDDTYECTVHEISEVKKGAKASYVRVTYQIAEGEFSGQKLFNNLMIDGKGAGMFVDFINKCMGTDYKVEDLRDEGLEVDLNDFIGCSIGVVVKAEEYPEGSGEMRAQVKSIVSMNPTRKSSEKKSRRK